MPAACPPELPEPPPLVVVGVQPALAVPELEPVDGPGPVPASPSMPVRTAPPHAKAVAIAASATSRVAAGVVRRMDITPGAIFNLHASGVDALFGRKVRSHPCRYVPGAARKSGPRQRASFTKNTRDVVAPVSGVVFPAMRMLPAGSTPMPP
jgi:hypothetical protein